MKLFSCDHCGHLVYFENDHCERCGRMLGYVPDANALVSLDGGPELFTAPALENRAFRYCANAAHAACNWLVPVESPHGPFCRACRHNGIIPAITTPDDLAHWQAIERAKKRLVYSLLRFNLPLATRSEDALHGLIFQFLADAPTGTRVLTGHLAGEITIALSEADDAERERRRTTFSEPYRTLLGHFRHEIGHYYWDLLVGSRPAELTGFRALFGDEGPDYGVALAAYHATGPRPDWQQGYISAYATAHPLEDFAETFAHYLHLVDTTETASAFGLRLRPVVEGGEELSARIAYDPYARGDVGELMDNWVPLSSLINNLNRAVGQLDAYPFVLGPVVVEKLGFIARLLKEAGATGWTVPGPEGPIPINRPPAH